MPSLKLLLTLVLPLVSFISAPLFAANNCQVELSTAMHIDSNTTAFIEDKADTSRESGSVKILYTIENNKELSIGKQKVQLTALQQKLISQYDIKIRSLIPEVRAVATESIDSAIEGITVAFSDFLGRNNRVTKGLNKKLTALKTQINNNLDINKGIDIGIEGLASENLLGHDFEQRIQRDIQQVVINSMGDILMVLGQKMLLSGGQGPDLETQINNFRMTIDHEIQTRTAEIGKKTNLLCADAIVLDELEEKIRHDIPQLKAINVFTVK